MDNNKIIVKIVLAISVIFNCASTFSMNNFNSSPPINIPPRKYFVSDDSDNSDDEDEKALKEQYPILNSYKPPEYSCNRKPHAFPKSWYMKAEHSTEHPKENKIETPKEENLNTLMGLLQQHKDLDEFSTPQLVFKGIVANDDKK